ncbi:MAG TPA: GH3 auxin-responsive promoter family protein, partial [Streptosporangiaceae bacterium]
MGGAEGARGAEYRERVLGEKRRLLAGLATPRQEQERALSEVLHENAGSQFGQAHRLSKVRDIGGFRRAVPIRTHEDLMPWITRAIAGEPNVLTAEEPVLYFSSSGTTGREKAIPVTTTYMRRCFLPFYFASFARLVEHYPQAFGAD